MQGFDLIGITETWWDSTYDWYVVNSYIPFSGVALLCERTPGVYGALLQSVAESLGVRIKGQTNKGYGVVDVSFGLSDQEEEIDETFYRQLEVASDSQALVILRDHNHPDICWRSNAARHKNNPQGSGKH